MNVVRNKEWRQQLILYIDNIRRVKFEYGLFDCALFAAGAIEAMTDVDLAIGFKNHYNTEKEGYSLLKSKTGFANHIMYAKSLFKSAPKSQAFTGDLAIFKTETDSWAIGVVNGAQVFGVHLDKGLFTLDLMNPRVKSILKV